MKHCKLLYVVLVMVVVGCGDDDVPMADGGSGGDSGADASASDAGADGGSQDAGNVMDASTDASLSDGSTDAAPLDASGDSSTADAGVCAGPLCDPGPFNYAFVTSSTHEIGSLGGLSGADAICNARASEAGLPGTYVAWLSSTTVHAVDRLTGANGWIRTDGRPFAASLANLTASRLHYPLTLDETGTSVGTVVIPTGTLPDGMRATGPLCTDWSDPDTVERVIGGVDHGGAQRWTTGFIMDCDMVRPIYCLGTDHDNAYEITPVEGRVAFVTAGTLGGNGGLAGGDGLCSAEAVAGGLSGSFRALLATTSATAASRFDTSGATWVRVDGIPLLDTALELTTASSLLAPVLLQADGTATQDLVWTGATRANSDVITNCNDWISTAVDVQTRAGVTDYSSSSWFGGGPFNCDRSMRFYCFEE